MTGVGSSQTVHKVNFSPPRSFSTVLKSALKETFFPDDPFKQFENESRKKRAKKAIQYFIPIFEWLPKYNFQLFKFDLLAGITIASLAIPQGISYAKLANIPAIVGLYSSFVPPLIYAVFGSSKHLAVGTVAASSLLMGSTIEEKVSPTTDPTLYLNLVFTATFFAGIFETALGVLRLGIVVDFLSHSTITGFMGGTAIIIILQQLKGIFGLTHFTTKTDVVSVLHAVFANRSEVRIHNFPILSYILALKTSKFFGTHMARHLLSLTLATWRWESAVLGIIYLAFLMFCRYLKKKNPRLFWVSAMAPLVTVVTGCLFAYFTHAEKHGIQIVGDLKKGLNPISIKDLNFSSEYLGATLKAGIITAILSMSEGIAIGRSFAIMTNQQTDGNKEMLAFGLMNIVGSFTSCYLTTGPFSKSAVNFSAGCKTAMSNVVMSLCMMLTLLVLAPLFKYTPLVALSAIIISAMLGLIDYEEAYRLFKVDKFDFVICMSGMIGVAFISMDIGLLISVGLAIVRALLYISRPATTKLVKIPNSSLYRDVEQYPGENEVPGVLVLQMGSPIYFANCSYIKERILRYIRDEQSVADGKANIIEHLLLDLGGVTSIDMTGVETLSEIRRNLELKGIKMAIIDPRINVLEKLTIAKFIDVLGKEFVFLSIEDAIESCRFMLNESKEKINGDSNLA
ncbi:SLC26A/SulP transporter domain [Dillenia turbinata]|uniref:SLC26A/SulP transporter domain n=1 Tax=Dillenia turbinata TaxID=194707 RepID=A0AAN8W4S5_9MAGN